MSTPGKLGAGVALIAYLALLFGMLAVGAPAQQHGIVAGLWVTEAIAIALRRVLAEPAHAVAMVAGAARIAPTLRWPAIADQYLRIVDSTVSRHAQAA